MAKIAVIQTGGKQYKVKASQKLSIEKIEGNVGDKVAFDKVLLLGEEDGKDVKVGSPYLEGAKVEGKIVEQGKAKKVMVVKYKAKTRYLRTKGHRQSFTKVEIATI